MSEYMFCGCALPCGCHYLYLKTRKCCNPSKCAAQRKKPPKAIVATIKQPARPAGEARE